MICGNGSNKGKTKARKQTTKRQKVQGFKEQLVSNYQTFRAYTKCVGGGSLLIGLYYIPCENSTHTKSWAVFKDWPGICIEQIFWTWVRISCSWVGCSHRQCNRVPGSSSNANMRGAQKMWIFPGNNMTLVKLKLKSAVTSQGHKINQVQQEMTNLGVYEHLQANTSSKEPS